jgi:hypothetical protein
MLDPTGTRCYVYVGDNVCTSVQPVWIGDEQEEGALSFEGLAHAIAPIVWPSPREFLLLEYRTLDVPGKVVPTMRNAGRTVYYRVREVRLKNADDGSTLIAPGSSRIRDPLARWSYRADDLPLDALDRVFVTFFFYYPADRGVGGHRHDVEAIEMQVRFRRVCRVQADEDSVPEAECPEGATTWPAAQLESASGSAHGVGWYTNTLRLSSAPDTVLPLTALVEENKHATTPDRDGDGTYMPHYDVNRHVNDAWGDRAVAGTGNLGGASFGAEGARRRHAADQVCPPRPSSRLIRHYAADRERTVGPSGCVGTQRTYQLSRSSTDPVCSRTSQLKSQTDSDRRLASLLDDKDFCEAKVKVKGPRNIFSRSGLRIARAISPGPDSEFGFQNAVQRLSFAYRYDGGHGASAVFPVGHEVPLVGGWLVMKGNIVAQELSSALPPISRGSIEAMYTPSASRPFDWYVTVGAEGDRSVPDQERRWSVVEEIGVRFRFSSERLRIIRFLGGRVGLRAESLTRPVNPRLVYEFGAGSW